MPDPDSTRFGYGPKRITSQKKSGGSGLGGQVGSYLANVQKLNMAAQDQQYLSALEAALSGGGMGGGGGGGRAYVGGGGGGYGGGGPSAYDQWRIAEEKRRREELERQKKALELGLAGQKKAAGAGIASAQHAALRSLTRTYNENRAATRDVTGQLQRLGAGQVRGARDELAGLRRDLGAQGGGGADMRALAAAANANITGTQFLQSNADSFNRRLAAVQGGARADAYGTADLIRQGGMGELENNYLQALMQIRTLGLL